MTKRDTRKYHFFPFEGCKKAIKKLTQHLCVHSITSRVERLTLSLNATVVKKGARKAITRPPEQPKITSLWGKPEPEDNPPSPSDSEESEMAEEPSMEVPPDNPSDASDKGMANSAEGERSGGEEEEAEFFEELNRYLTSGAGKGRTEVEAWQIAAETKKYLDQVGGGLQKLLSPKDLTSYMVHLDKSGGLAPATQAAKMNRVRSAITYYESTLPSPSENMPRVLDAIKNWSSTLQKEARTSQRSRLEMSEQQEEHSPDVQSFLDHPLLSSAFSKTVEACKADR